MASTTPGYDLPYLELDDAPDIAGATEDLAVAVETELTRIDANVAKINGLTPTSAVSSDIEGPYSGTTFSAGTVPCGVAFTAPPSGVVLVQWKADFQAGISNKMSFVSMEVRTGSTVGGGTVFLAANSNDALALRGFVETGVPLRMKGGTYRLVTSLTPGSAYHVRMLYQTESGGNISVFYRQITVLPQL